jgi:hypothetical protein
VVGPVQARPEHGERVAPLERPARRERRVRAVLRRRAGREQERGGGYGYEELRRVAWPRHGWY